MKKVIENHFVLISTPKQFPDASSTSSPLEELTTYSKRFTGYSATHYRIKLKPFPDSTSDIRYGDAMIEVQVASVLMHAWAEVEHDLVYKPLQGLMSEDELAILDELNGMVLAGEIALERLQRMNEMRIRSRNTPFQNQYELAAFLSKSTRPAEQGAAEPVLGDVRTLFNFLHMCDLAKPDALKDFLDDLRPYDEVESVALQVFRKLLASDEGLRNKYKASEEATNLAATKDEAFKGYFMSWWDSLGGVSSRRGGNTESYVQNGLVL